MPALRRSNGAPRCGALIANQMPSAASILAKFRRQGQKGSAGAVAFFSLALHQLGVISVTLLAASFLSPSEFGIFSLASILVLLLQEMSLTGVSQYIVTQKGDEKAISSTGFWMIFGFSTAGAGLLMLLSPLMARLYDAPQLVTIICLLAALQPLAAYAGWSSALLMRNKRMQLNYTINTVQNGLSLIGGLAVLIAWESIYALVVYRALHTVAGVVCFLIFGKELPSFKIDRTLMRDIYKFSSHMYLSRFVGFFTLYGTDFIIGATLSTAATGIYRLASRLAMTPIELIGQPLRTFALAQFGEANREDKPFTPVARRFISSMTFLMGGIGATVAVFGREVVTLAFQPEYIAAVPVTFGLIARSIIGISDSLTEAVLAPKGKTKLVLRHRAPWALAAVAASFFAAPYGAIWVSWSLAGVMIGASATALWRFRKHGDIKLRKVAGSAALSLALVAIYFAGATMVHEIITPQLQIGPLWQLVASLLICMVLGLIALAVAIKLRAVDLNIFSSR